MFEILGLDIPLLPTETQLICMGVFFPLIGYAVYKTEKRYNRACDLIEDESKCLFDALARNHVKNCECMSLASAYREEGFYIRNIFDDDFDETVPKDYLINQRELYLKGKISKDEFLNKREIRV